MFPEAVLYRCFRRNQGGKGVWIEVPAFTPRMGGSGPPDADARERRADVLLISKQYTWSKNSA